MVIDIFSSHFAEQVKHLAQSLSEEELPEKLPLFLSQSPLEALKCLFAHEYQKYDLKSQLFRQKKVSPKDLRKILCYFSDSPYYNRLALLSLLLEEDSSFAPFSYEDIPSLKAILEILFFQRKKELWNLLEKLPFLLPSLLPLYQWMRDFLLFQLFARPTIFPYPESSFPPHLLFPFSPKNQDFYLESWLSVLASFGENLQGKVCPLSSCSLIGDVAALGKYLELSEEFLSELLQSFSSPDAPEIWKKSWQKGFPKEFLTEELCLALLRHYGFLPFSHILPFTQKLLSPTSPLFSKKTPRPLWSYLHPRSHQTLFLALENPKKLWCTLSEWTPYEQQTAFLYLFLHFPDYLTQNATLLFHLSQKWELSQIFSFWHRITLFSQSHLFFERHLDSFLQFLQNLPFHLKKIRLLYLIAEQIPKLSSFLFPHISEWTASLHGKYRILAKAYQILWQLHQGKKASFEPVVQQTLAHPLIPEQREILEQIFRETCHTNHQRAILFTLPLLYLQDSFSQSSGQLGCTISSLASKAVLSGGWKVGKGVFDKALTLLKWEPFPYRHHNLCYLVFELVELSEAIGEDQAWQKAFQFVTKMRLPWLQKSCLLRLLRIPSYAISPNGAKILRVFREIARIRCEKTRWETFSAACFWLSQKEYLLYNTSIFRSVLKRISYAFRTPHLQVQSLAISGLTMLQWKREREAADFFSQALEKATQYPESIAFSCLHHLANILVQAEQLECKGEFIHELMEYIEKQHTSYASQLLAVIAYLLENWKRYERARKALERSFSLTRYTSTPWTQGLRLHYLLSRIAETPSLFYRSYRQDIEKTVLSLKTPFWKIQNQILLFSIYLTLGKLSKALEFLHSSLSLLSRQPFHLQRYSLHLLFQKLERTYLVEEEKEALEILFHWIKKELPLSSQETFLFQLGKIGLSFGWTSGKLWLLSLHSEWLRDQARELLILHTKEEKHQIELFHQISSPFIRFHTAAQLTRRKVFCQSESLLTQLILASLHHRLTLDRLLAHYIRHKLSPLEVNDILETLTQS